jgi:hypothetical protein
MRPTAWGSMSQWVVQSKNYAWPAFTKAHIVLVRAHTLNWSYEFLDFPSCHAIMWSIQFHKSHDSRYCEDEKPILSWLHLGKTDAIKDGKVFLRKTSQQFVFWVARVLLEKLEARLRLRNGTATLRPDRSVQTNWALSLFDRTCSTRERKSLTTTYMTTRSMFQPISLESPLPLCLDQFYRLMETHQFQI